MELFHGDSICYWVILKQNNHVDIQNLFMSAGIGLKATSHKLQHLLHKSGPLG